MKLIDVSTKKYPNTFTMVDDADFEWLNQWKWRKNSDGYVVRNKWESGRVITFFMHVEILKPPAGMLGDHRFGDKLDNRRENLRVCTRTENNRNRRPTRARAMPKGVYWDVRCFRARIVVNWRTIYLGRFSTESEAESAYKAAAIKYHGEFARLNQTQSMEG